MPERSIRKARLDDVLTIHNLLVEAAKSTPVIARSQAALYETLRDFYVFDEGEGVLGCCALHITWGDLAEIKSLSVDDACQGRGVGKVLVEACLEEARGLRLQRVFALTAVVRFFEKLGFRLIDKHDLPHKVWGDCMNCPKFPDCDESAVQINLAE
jgi:amino-acid N-acetyltransferase